MSAFFDAVYEAGLVRGRHGKVGTMVEQMRADFFSEHALKDDFEKQRLSSDYQLAFEIARMWHRTNLREYMARFEVSREEYEAYKTHYDVKW